MHMKNGCLRASALILSVILSLCALTGCGKKVEETETAPASEPKAGLDLGYAVDGVMATEDPDALQKAVDELFSQDETPFLLEYKQTGYSDNGIDFSCYLANAAENQYDMFLTLYGDEARTDMLYQSQLLRPGTSFQNLTLNHALNPGKHSVTVVFTWVDEQDGVFLPVNELSIAVDFTVQQS